LGKKRKSGGRKKGGSGRGKSVQCAKCGRMVPADKAKTVTKRVSVADRETERMIRDQGGFIQTKFITQKYCVSCSVHMGRTNIRSKRDRDAERPHAEQKSSTKKLTDDRVKEQMIKDQRRGDKKHGEKGKANRDSR